MKNKVVGPYVIHLVKLYNNFKDENDTIAIEATAEALMSRQDYRLCLEANYPELYKELKEIEFLYIKRD
jgi:hypothetical protein